jgi:hypothetical protein
MRQGNPEGFRSPIPEDLQEIAIAFVHAATRENLTNFGLTFMVDKGMARLHRVDDQYREVAAITFYYDAVREGGLDFLIRTAKIMNDIDHIQEWIENDQGDEFQKEEGQRGDEAGGQAKTA